jgi:hypothetical protein
MNGLSRFPLETAEQEVMMLFVDASTQSITEGDWIHSRSHA